MFKKLHSMINLYFATDVFYTPNEHKVMMEALKREIDKWRCYPIIGEIMIPVVGNFSQVSWYNKHVYEHFVQNAQVLIVDTTYTPRVHESLKSFFSEHRILLVECRKQLRPRSYPELNPPETREYVLTLEYQQSILEVSGYILCKICSHHASLHLIPCAPD